MTVVSEFWSPLYDQCTRVYVVCLCHSAVHQYLWTAALLMYSSDHSRWNQLCNHHSAFICIAACAVLSVRVFSMMERLIVHYMKPKTWSRSKLWGLTDQVETELSLGRTGRGSKGWCGKRSKCRTNSIRGSTDKLLICLLPAGPYKSLLVLHKSDNLL